MFELTTNQYGVTFTSQYTPGDPTCDIKVNGDHACTLDMTPHGTISQPDWEKLIQRTLLSYGPTFAGNYVYENAERTYKHNPSITPP